MTQEEIYKKALSLILHLVHGVDIQVEAEKLAQNYYNLKAKYKPGQEVWVLYNDEVIKTRVEYAFMGKVDGVMHYNIADKALSLLEEELFPSKEEIKKHLSDIMNNIPD